MPTLNKFFLVPAGDSPAEVDVGTVGTAGKPGEETNLATGSEVPALVGKDPAGKEFDLKSLRGKWVLMDFWGTWCGFCIAEHPNLQDAQEGWAADGRLALVSVSVDDTPEQVVEYVKKHGVAWQQVVLGKRKETKVPDVWKVDGYPTILLISPEGKVVETGLRGGRIRQALMKHVGKPTPPAKK
jgi:thiol-disulfide isomerase/thioredoxin